MYNKYINQIVIYWFAKRERSYAMKRKPNEIHELADAGKIYTPPKPFTLY